MGIIGDLLAGVLAVTLLIGVLIGGIMLSESTTSGFGDPCRNDPSVQVRATCYCSTHTAWSWELCLAVAQRKVSQDLASQHTDWGLEILTLVSNSRIQIGMTMDMVLESWGRPRDKDRFVSSYGVSESWNYYEWIPTPSRYNLFAGYYSLRRILNFENGVLTSWSEFD